MKYEDAPEGQPTKLTFEDNEPEVLVAAYRARKEILALHGATGDFEPEGEEILRWDEAKEQILLIDQPLEVVHILDFYFNQTTDAAMELSYNPPGDATEAAKAVRRRYELGEQAGKIATNLTLEYRIAHYKRMLNELGPAAIIYPASSRDETFGQEL
jgi:hypothetical protein